MLNDKESSAAGTDNRAPMLEENDYKSWKIRMKRQKRDEEFTAEENARDLADIQAASILSQGLSQHIFNTLNQTESAKEMNESIHEYFIRFHKLANDLKITKIKIPTHQHNTKFLNNVPSYWAKYVTSVKQNQDILTKLYVELYTYLKAYEPHALKTLKKQEQSSNSMDPLAYLAHSSKHQTSTTVASPTSTSSSTLAPEQQAQSGSDAMMATMQQLVNLLSGFQKQFPPTNNQLLTSSNLRSHATMHKGKIVTETVQRKAPGNVSNTCTKRNQGYGKKTYRNGKKVICYNCRGEGHVARECKEPKRAKDTQYYKDKMMLSDAKDRGVILDAEAEAFLADVECTEPYDESLAFTTTIAFQVSHQDAYDSDIDDGPHAAAAFMANLSSTEEANGTSSSKINEVHSNAFDSYNSDTDDNTMLYQHYLLLTKAVVPPTEKPFKPHYVSPGEMYLQDQITAIIPQLEGHIKTNKDLSRANESIKAELAQCKLEMQSLKRNKENSLLETTIFNKEESIKALNEKNNKVVSEKDLDERNLEEIVCLQKANRVMSNLLKTYQQPTHTIPMLSKCPNIATSDMHKTTLGSSNSKYGNIARESHPAIYDGNRLLDPTHVPSSIWEIEEIIALGAESRAKMFEKPGTVKPINYDVLNNSYIKLVPQKLLSCEQVYWQSASVVKAPFVHTRLVKSEVFSLKLAKSNMSSCAQLTGRITALIAKNATLKDGVKGKQNSGPTPLEKPKVLTPGMFTICTKYIPPPRRENWVAPAPKPRKKQVTFREPPRPSHSTTQRTAKHEKMRRVEDHHRNLNKQNHVDSHLNVKCTGFVLNSYTVCNACNESLVFANLDNCVVRNLKFVNVKTPTAKHNVKTTKKVWKAKVVTVRCQWKPTG
uniref:CCHC-type domain-containing protein n=1 Tax=Tanacetum cinerariifolium TaxID=118510 RepID=A0A6L2K406_TANCI|nr:hypothetical protein [Tanacetum cinerariifolium]